MKQQKVYILIGIAGSGKSYWAKQFISDLKNNQNTIIVSKDKIREMFYGRYRHKKGMEKIVHEISVKNVKHLLKAGFNVIIDETNITQERREKWIDVIKKDVFEDIKIIYVWFPNMNDNLKNRMNESKGVSRKKWEVVIESMKKRFEPPNPDKELYDEMIIIQSINVEDIKIKQNENLPKAICFDMDGTVSHMGDRDPFNASTCDDDIPDDNLVEIINLYKNKYKIIFVTARPYDYKEPTLKFLKNIGFDVENDSTFSLVMRGSGDFRKDAIVKEEMYRKYVLPQYYVKLIFDDRDQVVFHLRNLGFTVYQVANGNF